jgi:serine/threonine-protein kinase RsbW
MKKVLKLKNNTDEISKLSVFLEEISGELNLDIELQMSLNLVLEEAVANVIMYAYPEPNTGDIEVYAELSQGKIVFTIVDSGKEFDPTEGGNVDTEMAAEERPIGGLGIFLIKNIMDEVEYNREDGKNKFVMKKNISK